MNEYGDEGPDTTPQQPVPAQDPRPDDVQDPAPTWQWTGTPSAPGPGEPDPGEPGPSEPGSGGSGTGAVGWFAAAPYTGQQPFGYQGQSAPYPYPDPTYPNPSYQQSPYPDPSYPQSSYPQSSYPQSAGPQHWAAWPAPAGQPQGVAPQIAPHAAGGISRRTKIVGGVAALVLVAGAAVAGGAVGYTQGSHSTDGVASGGVGGQAPSNQAPNLQDPSHGLVPQSPYSQQPSTGGGGSGRGDGGRAQSYTPPGKATSDQQVGVVDIYTKLKYQAAAAAGTGMILTSDGEILTNNHVIEGATTIRVVVVSTGKKYAAKVVGTDKVDDVAVLQLAGASGLSPITVDSDGVNVGDKVTAVGNAMGVGGLPSAAKGTIVGVNRAITTQSEDGVDGERLKGLIEVDAQVISGDSGGPLYDSENEVVGMDTAASSSPTESRGFAIPISKALSIAQQIANGNGGGNIVIGVPGFLGIEFQPGTSYGGALVTAVVPGTPAAKLGLTPGDVVTSISGATVTSGGQLRNLLSGYKGGDSVMVTWTDTQGGSHTGSVTLIDGPAA